MSGLNKVTLIGRLGADPEIRRTQSGDKIANLRLATSETWRDKNSGERKEKTEWHRVVVFNDGLAGVCEQYLKKGSQIYVEGKLQTRKWTDQSNVERYSTEIILQGFGSQLLMLDGKNSGGGSGGGDRSDDRDSDNGRSSDRGGNGGGSRGGRFDIDDDIPFEMEWRG